VNITILSGTLTSEPRVTRLSDRSVVHNFDVRAPAETPGGSGGTTAAHLVPVAWYDPQRPPRLREGDAVVVLGAVRRRWFRAGGATQSRTEVVASVVARSGTRTAERALGRAIEVVGGSGSIG
jgi:single-strand DNA-binding protein